MSRRLAGSGAPGQQRSAAAPLLAARPALLSALGAAGHAQAYLAAAQRRCLPGGAPRRWEPLAGGLPSAAPLLQPGQPERRLAGAVGPGRQSGQQTTSLASQTRRASAELGRRRAAALTRECHWPLSLRWWNSFSVAGVVVQQQVSQSGHRRGVLECWQEPSVPRLVAQVPQAVEGAALRNQLGGQDSKFAPAAGRRHSRR